MKWLEAVCMVFISACVGYVLIEAALLERDFRAELPQVTGQAKATLLDYSRLAQDSVGVTAEIRKTLKAAQDSNEQTARNSAAATANLNGDLLKFGKVLDNLDATVTATSAYEQAVSTNLNETIVEARPAINNLTRASKNAADAMGDPAIHAALVNVSSVSQNLAGTSAEMQMTAHDIRTFVHRETSPVTGTWNVIKGFLREFAGPAAEVATALK